MEAYNINLCEYDEDEMQEEHDEKCNEVLELQNELRASQLEAQHLRMRLKSVLPLTGSQIALPGSDVSEDQRRGVEMRSFFEWLAVCMDISHSEELEVGLQVPMQGRQIFLGKMMQWHSSVGRLQLSVPTEFSEEVLSVFKLARAQGGHIEEGIGRRLADSWELLPTVIVVAGQQEPAVLLVRRGQKQGAEQSMLVASWPTREHVESEIERAASDIDANELPIGMRVEVEFEGQWYCGILHEVDVVAGRASVICDVDAPGIVTRAPISSLRPLVRIVENSNRETPLTIDPAPSQQMSEEHRYGQRECFGSHRRSRSAM